MDSLSLLEEQAAAWGLYLDGSRRECLLEYARLLASYDRANVIGTRDLDGILLAHVLDSLSCFLYRPLFGTGRLADVGSGGGLPGIPIKIVKPDLEATLVESTGKRASFLRYAVESLSLEDVEVANVRVEEFGRERGCRRAYDIVTSRAVARLFVVARFCLPLLEAGGRGGGIEGRFEEEGPAEGRRAADALGARVVE